MPSGPLGGPRPASSCMLVMEITESPVPTGEPQTGVFPPSILRADDTEKAIIATMESLMDDMDNDSPVNSFTVDRSVTVRRGLGETVDVTIKADISGAEFRFVDQMVSELTAQGFQFSSVRFE